MRHHSALFALVGLMLSRLAAGQAAATTTTWTPPWETGVVTPDGTCGGTTGYVCAPSWGTCCGSTGQCGRTDAFCGTGCQSAAGYCYPSDPSGLGTVSPDSTCGGTNQYTCQGSSFGNCCSSAGHCGSDSGHCGSGCQTDFGTCNSGSGGISSNGSCGAVVGKTCTGSTFGTCCSSSNFCGTGSDFCSAGCQSAWGTCDSGSGTISTDGRCGTFNGKTCKGSTFGDCCSSAGWCGTSTDSCGPGCQSTYGTCSSGSGTISTDGKCGSANGGKTCKGSTFGDCCSSAGWCGSTTGFCDAGCQSTYGTCNAGSGTISTDGKCGSANGGKTCKGSTFGNCCSSGGWCGSTTGFCDAGCQSTYGTCNSGSGSISTDGRCGSFNSKTCAGSTYGNCCSSGNYCGKTGVHCGQGCQKGFSSGCLTTNIPSNDGTCGSKVGLTCTGGSFDGDCCSSAGHCGTTSAHCGTGCQKGYGVCK